MWSLESTSARGSLATGSRWAPECGAASQGSNAGTSQEVSQRVWCLASPISRPCPGCPLTGMLKSLGPLHTHRLAVGLRGMGGGVSVEVGVVMGAQPGFAAQVHRVGPPCVATGLVGKVRPVARLQEGRMCVVKLRAGNSLRWGRPGSPSLLGLDLVEPHCFLGTSQLREALVHSGQTHWQLTWGRG